MDYYSSLDASQLDRETPTLFELISANQLDALLSPSLRYILVHYAQRYPQYLLRVTNRFDELNLLLRWLVEWYFFRHWRGSFTENFYGIKRVSQTPLSNVKYNAGKLTSLSPAMIEEQRKLSRAQTAASLFEATGVPYLSEKLSHRYELLYSKLITGQLESGEAGYWSQRKVRLQRLFVAVFPYAQSAYRLANLAATLAYLSGTSRSPSVLTFLFRINYARLNQADYARNEPPLRAKTPTAARNRPSTSVERLLKYITRFLLRPSFRTLKYMLGTFFPLAIFSLKFLEWWSNSDFAQKLAKSQQNTLEERIPPPSVLGRLQKSAAPVYKSGPKCPLCKEEIQNPAIIETGYVFDYKCIYEYLRDSHKLVGKTRDHDESDSESDYSDAHSEQEKDYVKEAVSSYDVSKGGRCPITGRKLLGCRWNELTGEFDVTGLRRIIF